MRKILDVLNSDNVITRENYKNIIKILMPSMLEQTIFNNFTLIDYIMQKDFESEYDRRHFIEYVFSLGEVSDNIKLNIYLKILLMGVESCFVNPSNEYDSNFCSIAYLKVGKMVNKKVFRDSRELALLFSRFAPFLATKHQKGIEAKRKIIAKKIMLSGLVSENYAQIIDNKSNKRGIEELVKYLMKSENYGIILKLFKDNVFEVNEDNYQLIVSVIIEEYVNREKDTNTRYNDEEAKQFIELLQAVLENNLTKSSNMSK